MPNDVDTTINRCDTHIRVPLPTVAVTGPMTVLSSPPRGIAWHRASIIGAAAVYGFAIVALSTGMHHPIDGEKNIKLEFVEVSATFEPEPPPASAIGETPTAELPSSEVLPQVSRPESTLPADDAPPPIQPTTDPPVEESPVLSTPSSQSMAKTEVEPSPPQATPSPTSAKTVTSKLSRPQPRISTVHQAVSQPKVQPANVASENVSDGHFAAAATLTSLIRDAVQAAVQCPKAARMMDQSGKVGVAFDYRDGAVVGSVQIARSSGIAVLDAAALAAVRNAHYPQAPSGDSNQMLHFLIWVEEACGG